MTRIFVGLAYTNEELLATGLLYKIPQNCAFLVVLFLPLVLLVLNYPVSSTIRFQYGHRPSRDATQWKIIVNMAELWEIVLM